MDPRTHIVAVVDCMDDREPTLSLARATVRDGGTASVLVRLDRIDRIHIRDYASAEDLSLAEAAARYETAVLDVVREEVGDDGASVDVTDDVRDGRRVLASAIAGNATQVAIPSRLAGRRGWRRAISSTHVPVVVAPSRAA